MLLRIVLFFFLEQEPGMLFSIYFIVILKFLSCIHIQFCALSELYMSKETTAFQVMYDASGIRLHAGQQAEVN